MAANFKGMPTVTYNKLTLTAVTSSPPSRELDLGNAMTELRVLEDTASMYRNHVNFELVPAADVRRLLQTIMGSMPGKSSPDILHFIGHGATLLANALTGEHIANVPLLMTTTGPRYERQADVYDPSAIAKALSFAVKFANKPRLIVLQACKTAAFAKKLARLEPKIIVLAWQTQVLDEGCHAFSSAFYSHLFSRLYQKGGWRMPALRRVGDATIHYAPGCALL